jgi:hypothetical protein
VEEAQQALVDVAYEMEFIGRKGRALANTA